MPLIQTVTLTFTDGRTAEYSGPVQVKPSAQLLHIKLENRESVPHEDQSGEKRQCATCNQLAYAKSELCFDHLLESVTGRKAGSDK